MRRDIMAVIRNGDQRARSDEPETDIHFAPEASAGSLPHQGLRSPSETLQAAQPVYELVPTGERWGHRFHR
jgi:hypothetical protein